jgi:hypothetical protein
MAVVVNSKMVEVLREIKKCFEEADPNLEIRFEVMKGLDWVKRERAKDNMGDQDSGEEE